MSVKCGVCRLPCEDPSKVIRCSGSCGSNNHLDCVPLKTRNAKKDWFCDVCKIEKDKTSSTTSSKSVTVTEMSKEFFINTLESLKHEIMGEMKKITSETAEFRSSLQKITSENAEFRSSLQFLSDSIDKSNTLMEDIKKQLKKTQEENLQLLKENSELRLSVDGLEGRLRHLEQHARRQNIEIDGIPETSGENIDKIVQDVAAAIGVEFRGDTVVAAHRVPSFNKNRIKPIIVRFTNYDERDRWISGFRTVRPLPASSVNASFKSSSKVYINEHLTPENKSLLSKVKDVAKNKNYKYVWCRNGKMFVRKDSNDRCIKIERLSDTDKL